MKVDFTCPKCLGKKLKYNEKITFIIDAFYDDYCVSTENTYSSRVVFCCGDCGIAIIDEKDYDTAYRNFIKYSGRKSP